MINIVDRMVRAFGQQLAPEKLKILMIDPVFIPFPRTWPIIKLGGENITVVTQARFLGRTDTLDSAIDIELEERLDIMKSTFHKDRRQFYCRSSISTKARLEIFVAKVVRKTLAGCQTWNITPAQIEELEHEYFNMVRIILRLPWCRQNQDGSLYYTPPPNSHPIRISREAIIAIARSRKAIILPIEAHIYIEQARYLGHIHRHKSELPYQTLRATTPSRAPAPIRGHAHNLPIASHHRALSALGFNLSTWEDSALDRKSWRETLHTTGVRRFMQWWTEKRAKNKPHRQTSTNQPTARISRGSTESSSPSQAEEQTIEEGERMEAIS